MVVLTRRGAAAAAARRPSSRGLIALGKYFSIPRPHIDYLWYGVIKPRIHRRRHRGKLCWEYNHSIGSQGYPTIERNFYVHIIVLLFHHQLPSNLDHLKGAQASHLCHSKRCIRPKHIIFESNRNNNRRNVCPYRVESVIVCRWIHEAPACLHAHSRFEKDGVRVFSGYSSSESE